MGNDRVLTLFHDARVAWMNEIHQTELDFFKSSLIQHDAVINYKAEGLQGDDIFIDLFIDDIDEKSFDFYYRMIRKSDDKEIALGKTGMTFFNYQEKKIDRTPQDFLDWCQTVP